MKPQIIAFYLPQYHPTPHNDEWWGKGFTEWTNVAKAKPLFRGHYQPKIPADLGFYDLRVPEVREQQAELAREAGVYGFCYYEYWFGNGHEELELPFQEVINTGKPDFPFCLCWANESWYKKFWNNDGAIVDKKILAEQTYPGEDDYKEHFKARLKAFRDPRYIKVEGKLLYMIYKPLDFPNIKDFMNTWQKLAKEHDLPGFFFIGYTLNISKEYDIIKCLGFDAICSCHLGYGEQSRLMFIIRKIISIITNTPRRFSYKKMVPQLLSEDDGKIDVFPTILPNWDHTPRSGKSGYVYTGTTPDLFYEHAQQVLSCVSSKAESSRICFLKSWNEWGEGNYMEPDIKYGKGYINALRKALDNTKDQNTI